MEDDTIQSQVEDTIQLQVPIPRFLHAKLRVVAMWERKTIRDLVISALTEHISRSDIQIRIDPKSAFGKRDTSSEPRKRWDEYSFPGGRGRGICHARGDMVSGFVCRPPGPPRIDGPFLREILRTFAGQTIPGGFQATGPPRNGFGYWVAQNSGRANSVKLGPIHACHIAAILIKEAGVEFHLDGPHNRVMLKFPVRQ